MIKRCSMSCKDMLPSDNLLSILNQDSEDVVKEYLKQFTTWNGFDLYINSIADKKSISQRRPKTKKFIIEYDEDINKLKDVTENLLHLPLFNQSNTDRQAVINNPKLIPNKIINILEKDLFSLLEEKLEIKPDKPVKESIIQANSQIDTVPKNEESEVKTLKSLQKKKEKARKSTKAKVKTILKKTQIMEESKEENIKKSDGSSHFDPQLFDLFDKWDVFFKDKESFQQKINGKIKVYPDETGVSVTPNSINIKERNDCKIFYVTFTLINVSPEWLQLHLADVNYSDETICRLKITGNTYIRFTPGSFEEYKVDVYSNKSAENVQVELKFLTKRSNQITKQRLITIKCLKESICSRQD